MDESQARAALGTSGVDVFKLSVPMFVELLMQFTVGYVDQLMLSHLGLGPAAAVGNALQIINLITVMLSAMASASTVLVTRALGAGRERLVNEIATVALATNGLLAVVVTVAVFALWPQVFSLLNVGEDIYAMSRTFLLIVVATTPLQGIYLAVTALLRSYGRVADVMVAGVVGNVANIACCVVLVNGVEALGIPALGLVGSAASLVAARVVMPLVALWFFVRHTPVRPRLADLAPFPRRTFAQMLGIGVPSSGEQFSYDLSQTVILAFVNTLGSAVVTVRVYCNMCANVAYLYSIAVSQATQIVIGYLFGQGKPGPIPRRVWTANAIAITVSVSVTVLLWLNSDKIFGLVTGEPSVLALGHTILGIEIFLEVGRSLNIVFVRSLIALGDIRTPVIANIVSSWTIGVGGSWLLGIHFGWGLAGMWVAMAADEWLRGIFFAIKFAMGSWRKNVPVQSGTDERGVS